MMIEVTQDHIDRGKHFESGYCPVALALKDALDSPEAWAGAALLGDGKGNTYAVPHAVRNWIRLFDDWRKREDQPCPVSPFSFPMPPVWKRREDA